MDNYIKHLLDRIPLEKKVYKDEDGQNCIKIIFNNLDIEISYYLQVMSDVYKITGDIVIYLKKMSKVVVQVISNEIIIKYQ